MKVTSNRNYPCDKYWKGPAIYLNINDERKRQIPRGFTEYQYCLPFEQVNVINDRFQFKTHSSSDGVCISSVTINQSQILFGRKEDQAAFWLKAGNKRRCAGELLEITSDVIIQNYTVISSQCKGRHYQKIYVLIFKCTNSLLL